MRKLIVMFVAAAFVCSLGTALAADTKTATTTAKHTTLKHASGELVSTSGTSVVVKEKSKDVTFTTDEKTKYRVGGKFAKAEDLKAGDHVTVKYEHNGDAMLAHEIDATAATAKAAPAAPAAPAAKPAEAPKK